MSSTIQNHSIQVDHNVPIPMRDGTILRAEIYRPPGEGKWPVIVERFLNDPTEESNVEVATYFSRCGYVYLFNNVRGTGQSAGNFFPLADDGWGEAQDGYDTVEWAAHQPWSNGKVGMFGGSYGGFTQYLTAPTRPPSLRACFAIYSSNAREIVFPKGIYRLDEHRGWALWMAHNCLANLVPAAEMEKTRNELNQTWDDIDRWFRHLPLKEFPPLHNLSPWYFEHLRHPLSDPWWDQFDARLHFSEIDIPILHLGGWYDLYLDGTLEHFTGLREQGGSAECRHAQQLIIGPWAHWSRKAIIPVPLQLGDDAIVDFRQLGVEWFDQWLKGNATSTENKAVTSMTARPTVRIFLMGENRWLSLDEWPPAHAIATPFYLRQGSGQSGQSLNNGQLSREMPTADEPADHYLYDPNDPIIGHQPDAKINALDQEAKEGRLLTYSSELLDKPLTVIGHVKAVLFAASSAPDTDWVVRLCDVWPDGRSIKVCEGIVRARYRHSYEYAEFMQPGTIYRFEIDLSATAQTFPAGHRLRIHVTSSDFPVYERNLNTGGPFGEETIGQIATNTIFHDSLHPSHITLPLIA